MMNRKIPSFSKPFDEALIRAELVQEMMIEDGWKKGEEEELFARKAVMDIFFRHADAALRVMRRIEERENNIKPSETD